ncbi:MAG: tyrosine-type recombinase/integrase [Chitinispirillia bacterium]|nr:tyrosine-type recombinase/integrase [Chitinispirillia bacterium]
MRRAPGTGNIIKLKRKRLRKPYLARVFAVNRHGEKTRICLGCYATIAEADKALKDYYLNSVDIVGSYNTRVESNKALEDFYLDSDRSKTFSEVFTSWYKFAKDKELLSDRSLTTLKSAYNKHFKALYDFQYCKLEIPHYQRIIDNCSSAHVQKSIKTLIFNLDNYAISQGIIKIGTSIKSLITKKITSKNEREIFTDDDIKYLWGLKDNRVVSCLLILLYSGMRIEELMSMTADNVNITEGYFRIVKAKTPNGMRKIPIHAAIMPLVKSWYIDSETYFIRNTVGNKWNQHNFRLSLKRLKLDINHIPHETRHTVETALSNLGVNQVIIDRLLGHSSGHVGRDVYTHITFDQLREAINKIKVPK